MADIDLDHQVAPTLAAYAINLAQGKEVMPHEFTHILELAAKAGVKVDEDVARRGYRAMSNLRQELSGLQVRHDAVMASFSRPRWRRIFDAVFR